MLQEQQRQQQSQQTQQNNGEKCKILKSDIFVWNTNLDPRKVQNDVGGVYSDIYRLI